MEWLNARNDLPEIFGKYFVKINGIKHIISLQEFDFYLERGEEVLWLNEGKKSNVITKIIDDPTQAERILDLQSRVVILQERIRILDSRLKSNIRESKIDTPECMIVAEEEEEGILINLTKDEVKKFLNKRFRPSYDGLTLKSVKRLFPQLRNATHIPPHLKDELIEVYTEEGVELIEYKLKRSKSVMFYQKKKRDEDEDMERRLANKGKENNIINHLMETMKYIDIEFNKRS